MSWQYTLRELAAVIGAGSSMEDRDFSSVSTDTRTIKPGDLFFALSGANFDGNRFVPEALEKGACAAVTSGRSGGRRLIVADPLKALQQFAAWHRRKHDIPLLAITGSCGKTSTKDMISAVLATRFQVATTRGNLNNEIGCPLSVLAIDGEAEFAVIEMGTNHPGEIAALCNIAQPTEAAITMIGPAHLEGFGSIENVARAKAELVEALPSDGVFFVNTDDPWCVEIARRFPGTCVTFGAQGDVRMDRCAFDEDGEMRVVIAPVGEMRLPLLCRAHAANVALAVAVGLHHGVIGFEAALREACARATRFRRLGVGPLTALDDSYNANPSSMAAALAALAEYPGRGARMAVLGEMLELGDAAGALHREIGAMAAASGVSLLLAQGKHAAEMVEAARSHGVKRAEALESHAAMAAAIHEAARPGDVLLIKGSRGMRMERVIDELRHLYERD